MGNTGLPSVGNTFDLTLSDAVSTSFAILVSSTSSVSPTPLPGAPGCNLLVSTSVLSLELTTAAGTAASPISVPDVSGLIGQSFFFQWGVWDPTVNSLKIVTSDAGQATIGQ